MTGSGQQPPLERRSFLTRLGAGAAAFSTAMGLGPREGVAQGTSQPGGWQPARHPQDDWFDQVPGKHRFFFDATSQTGAGEAITFATNYYLANKAGYGLESRDLAVVICLRHWATAFAFNDAIWAKYGTHLAERIKFTDPRTQAAPTKNVYLDDSYGMQLPNRGTTLDDMIARGTHFAICGLATRAFSGIIATKVGAKPDEIYAELNAGLIANAHMMAAGIVAVNRAQERGYSLQYIG